MTGRLAFALSALVVAACGSSGEGGPVATDDAGNSGSSSGLAGGSGSTGSGAGSSSGEGGTSSSSGGNTTTSSGGGSGTGSTSGTTSGSSSGGSAGSSSGTAGYADAGAGADGGGDAARVCPLPTAFKWTSTGPLASPQSPTGHDFVSLKDFTCVHWNNLFSVYATVYDETVSGWNMVNFNFGDWSDASAASQFYMQNSPTHGGVAPQLFFFTPKNEWILVYQWGATYATSTDPTKPQMWSAGKSLLTGGPSAGIDYSVICDSQDCYLFFAGDDGNVYQSSMPVGQFPSAFNGYKVLLTDSTNNLFESPRIYSVIGSNPTKYLLIVEAIGSSGRYFRSFTSTSLASGWTAYAATQQDPFAGTANVTFEDGAWTNDVSHGDMVRYDPSETMPIDPCNMQFLYQGYDKTMPASTYDLIPYRPALLTMTQ